MAQSKADLVKEYRKLAKRADQRLVRLEKMKGDEFYENVEKFAYAGAERDIKRFFGEGHTRFNVKLQDSLTVRQIQARINAVNSFLDFATSTKKGIKKTFEDKTRTINEKYGLDLSWQETAQIFRSGLWDKLEKEYGSDTAWKMIGKFDAEDKILEMAENAADGVMSDDDFLTLEEGFELPFD